MAFKVRLPEARVTNDILGSVWVGWKRPEPPLHCVHSFILKATSGLQDTGDAAFCQHGALQGHTHTHTHPRQGPHLCPLLQEPALLAQALRDGTRWLSCEWIHAQPQVHPRSQDACCLGLPLGLRCSGDRGSLTLSKRRAAQEPLLLRGHPQKIRG